MTVSTTDSRVSYATDGSSVDYTVTFPFLLEGDLIVTFIDAEGTVAILSIGGDYTVAGGDNNTGTVTTTSPLDENGILLIVRDVPFTQPTDYVNNDKTDAEVQERALDRGCMLSQQLVTRADRGLRLSEAFTGTFDTQLPLVLVPGSSLMINDASDGLDLGVPLASAGGRFLQRQVFTSASLVTAGGSWTRLATTKRLHILVGTGVGENLSADFLQIIDVSGAPSLTYTGWSLGDGGVAPGGDVVMSFQGTGLFTLTTGTEGIVNGIPGLGWVFDTSPSTEPYLIIDEYS